MGNVDTPLHNRVLAETRAQASDDDRDEPKGPFSSRAHCVQQVRKEDWEPAEIEAAITDLVDAGALLSWHGLLVPVDQQRYDAVVAFERSREYPRELLIAKFDRLLAEREGESQEVSADA